MLYLSRGQPRSAAEIHLAITRLGVHSSCFTQSLNANDEFGQRFASLRISRATPALWSSHSGRKCGATRRRRPT